MTTTTLQAKVFEGCPFVFLETRRLLRLAMRVEHCMELGRNALATDRVDSSRYMGLTQRLRRAIDGLADVSREWLEEFAGQPGNAL